MPLVVMSPNIQDGESPSRKRSHEDYLGHDAAEAQTLKAFQLRPDAENMPALHDAEKAEHASPTRRPPISLSADSPPAGSPLSLMTDAGSSTPARPSPSPNPTPLRSTGLSTDPMPRLVINIDASPGGGGPKGSAATAATASSSSSGSGSGSGSGTSGTPAKRRRLTPAEREEKAKAEAARKAEKERAEAAKKQEKERVEAARKQEKAAAEAEKRARADEREREREKKRKQREEDERRRADEKEKKEKKRKQREEEERRVQEAKDKKERSQLRLNSFFKAGPAVSTASTASAGSTPHSSAAHTNNSPEKKTAASSPRKKTPPAEESAYDRMFKPFFVKENVVMTTELYGMDEETKAVKSRILDEYLRGARGPFEPGRLTAAEAVTYFQLPCRQRRPRGRQQQPTVRKIMSLLAEADDMGDTRNAQTKMALDLLKTIPMKFLGFREDVRPAYYGTATNIPAQVRLSKLARNPLTKTELPLNYDYDSEAEWVDDDGEDVDDLDDGEEEEVDSDGEMADFLDDSEDAAPLRPAFGGSGNGGGSGGMEPESTGLCWEDEQRRGPRPDMEAFRMEMILDHDSPIDPFSTQYWEPASEPAAEADQSMAPPPVPAATDAFALLGASGPNHGSGGGSSNNHNNHANHANGNSNSNSNANGSQPPKAVVAAEYVGAFKKAIMQYAKLSKIGIVEILSAEFGKCTKKEIKNSLEAMAERTGAGQQKTWKLKEGFAL